MSKDLSVQQAKRIHAKRYDKLPSVTLEGPRFEIEYGQERYPEALLALRDPPRRLYGIGNVQALHDGLAIIGARKATPYGRAAAHQFSVLAAQRGIPIISGGALGCDSEAHRGALEAGGQTVVVLGGGCNQIYPPGNQDLFQEVIDAGGAVISERQWDFPPLPYTFRARNRIIAGLARATLIVEAGLPSGTFSTADDALSLGREVLAVPGPITSPTSRGANRLIYQGATPIVDSESFEDVLVGIFGCLRMEDARTGKDKGWLGKGHGEEGEQDPLLAALLANPMRVEQLLALPLDQLGLASEGVGAPVAAGASDVGGSAAGGTGAPPSTSQKLTHIMMQLAAYERDGLIARFPDGRYGPAQV